MSLRKSKVQSKSDSIFCVLSVLAAFLQKWLKLVLKFKKLRICYKRFFFGDTLSFLQDSYCKLLKVFGLFQRIFWKGSALLPPLATFNYFQTQFKMKADQLWDIERMDNWIYAKEITLSQPFPLFGFPHPIRIMYHNHWILWEMQRLVWPFTGAWNGSMLKPRQKSIIVRLPTAVLPSRKAEKNCPPSFHCATTWHDDSANDDSSNADWVDKKAKFLASLLIERLY